MARPSDPTRFTIAQAREALAKKDISAGELARAHIDAIAKAHALNAFITRSIPSRRNISVASAARNTAATTVSRSFASKRPSTWSMRASG